MKTNMKTIMMAINKPHTDNIIAGLKIRELRKKCPKPPFRVLAYETLNKGGIGKVRFEFIVDKVDEYKYMDLIKDKRYLEMLKESCITGLELLEYAPINKPIKFLNITKLKIYEEPKDITDYFHKHKKSGLTIPVLDAPQSYIYIEAQNE
jgi:predicted transcriptional regulator